MLPDKVADAAVLQDGFEGTVGGLVHGCGAKNGHIINVWYSILGNVWLKDMCNIIVEYGYCICPTHWEFGQTECAIQCLNHGVVARGFSECMLIVAYIQVEHPSTGTTCKLLSNLFSEWSDTGMLDCDAIEGFEAMDWVKGFSLFLGYAEPV